MPKPKWDPEDRSNYFQHSGGIYHYNLKLPKVCLPIIDSPAFQRLDNIGQLGICRRIYRQATHTRFEHCFGVADLARRVMIELRKQYKCIDGNDVLCVIIAGLCHDLGHGPFSHTFEFTLKELENKHPELRNFRHEKMSVDILKYILKSESNATKILDEYLEEKDYTFIYELIDPPQDKDKYGNPEVKGRDKDKIWMYEIISNNIHGLDIDKMDYIIRDSHHTEVGVACNLAFISRCIEGVYILEFGEGEKKKKKTSLESKGR